MQRKMFSMIDAKYTTKMSILTKKMKMKKIKGTIENNVTPNAIDIIGNHSSQSFH